MESLSGNVVSKFFTSKEKIISSESKMVFSITSLAALVLVSIFAPSILSKNELVFCSFSLRTYRGVREQVVVVYPFFELWPVQKVMQPDHQLTSISLVSIT